MIASFLTALAFGLSIPLILLGSILGYRAFFEETIFENPLVPMALSFVFAAVGLTFLYLSVYSSLTIM